MMKNFKTNDKNDPRVFANSINFKENKTIFKKIFLHYVVTENDKCPPWSIQSSKMLHDNKKKTIYYDNALLKYTIFQFSIFQNCLIRPKCKKKVRVFAPNILDTKNLGSSISVPYFFDLNKDKNFTLTNRFFVSENPYLQVNIIKL